MLLCTLLLAGCTEQETQTTPQPDPGPPPPPTLKAEWSIPGLNSNPDTIGQHHWVTFQFTSHGMGRNMSSTRGPVLMVDARSGKTRKKMVEPTRWPCLTPTQISDSTVVPVLWATYSSDPLNGSYATESCDQTFTALDVATGKILWRDDDLDLEGIDGIDTDRVIAANDQVVAVVDSRGRSACFSAREGDEVADTDRSCRALRDHVTHADLPALVDIDGDPAPLAFGADLDVTATIEIGRTDEVVLVRAYRSDDNAFMVRAHDLETGETLWEDAQLTADPYPNDAWGRGETYFVAPSGVVRVSYEHPEDEEGDGHPAGMEETPMVLTAVDPMTGEDIKPIARINGAWFNHQFGDMTVALTTQERGLKSQISGFRLPTW